MVERRVVLDEGVERITDDKGNTYINRVPKKKLNPFVKAKLLATLKRDDIIIDPKLRAGSNTWVVKDSKGKLLFSYENGWDYGYYYIEAQNPNTKENVKVAEMDWYENDGHTNAEQQDIFDIFNKVVSRQKELEAAKANNQAQKLEQARKELTADEVFVLQGLGFDEKVRI